MQCKNSFEFYGNVFLCQIASKAFVETLRALYRVQKALCTDVCVSIELTFVFLRIYGKYSCEKL